MSPETGNGWQFPLYTGNGQQAPLFMTVSFPPDRRASELLGVGILGCADFIVCGLAVSENRPHFRLPPFLRSGARAEMARSLAILQPSRGSWTPDAALGGAQPLDGGPQPDDENGAAGSSLCDCFPGHLVLLRYNPSMLRYNPMLFPYPSVLT